MRYKNILDAIGNTPVVELQSFSPSKDVRIFAKLEGSNPGGSIKDRVALFMIRSAERSGQLTKDKTLIEATSGNTGIGLAMVSSVLGYKFVAVMSAGASVERRKLIRAFSAETILTNPDKGSNGAIKVAQEIVKKDPDKYLMLDQYNNPANPEAHYKTTGPEIITDIPEITHFVAGMGTGGTLMGIGRRLKEHNPEIKIVGVEPAAKTFVVSQGLRNMKEYSPGIYDETKLDFKLELKNDQSPISLARQLAQKEGLSVGGSSGAALWGALQIANKIKRGTIVTIFPDRGERYLSTKLFRGRPTTQ